MNKIKEFAIIGLGKMGSSLALQAQEKGFNVIGYDVQKKIREQLSEKGIHTINSIDELNTINGIKVIFLYVPAGKIVDKVIHDLKPILSSGDIIIDAGNSYWGDSIRRAEELKNEGIILMDTGTSGGIRGARNGACFMTGGDKKTYQQLAHIYEELSVSDGAIYTGPSGSGHFVKLVHNGIEFGMLQAIGEGMSLLDKFHEKLDVPEVLKCWSNGSVIRSWLIELMREQYVEQNGSTNTNSYIEDTGEVNWLVNDAMKMDVPVPVISQSVMELMRSRDKNKTDHKSVSLMRHGFGEHPFGPLEGIRKERETGKVGKFPESLYYDND